MEYGRNETYQFCDTDLCMLIDRVTGEPIRVNGNAVATFAKAIKALKAKKGWEERTVLVKMKCITGFKL